MFRARDEVEERVRETREAWQGSQAEMMKTVSGLQGTGPALHYNTYNTEWSTLHSRFVADVSSLKDTG